MGQAGCRVAARPACRAAPADDGLARRQQVAEALREWHAAMSPHGPPAPADDGLARQQAAEALAGWQASMTDEGSLSDMLSAGQQMAEFIADWLDAGGMPPGVDNPGYFGLGGPTA